MAALTIENGIKKLAARETILSIGVALQRARGDFMASIRVRGQNGFTCHVGATPTDALIGGLAAALTRSGENEAADRAILAKSDPEFAQRDPAGRHHPAPAYEPRPLQTSSLLD